MYKMKLTNTVAIITAISFIPLELYMILEMILKKGHLNESAFWGSIVVLIISFGVSLIFIPISKRYFFYNFTEDSFVVKFYFYEKRIKLIDVKDINFEKKEFRILLKNGISHIEKNRLDNKNYEDLKTHFKKVLI